jgi:hypothetical protein
VNYFLTLVSSRKFWIRMALCAGILKPSMRARNRVGKGLAYRPARLHRLGIDSLESILGPLKSLKMPSLVVTDSGVFVICIFLYRGSNSGGAVPHYGPPAVPGAPQDPNRKDISQQESTFN